MGDRKCPFSAPLVAEDFACSHADQLVRRGGAEISCLSAAAQPDCVALFEALKQAALPSFELEDDLLSMPHSTLVKIQYGGLLGLQAGVGGSSDGAVEDVHELVQACVRQAGSVDGIPLQPCVEQITGFRLRRRRKR